jgi:predicted nucleic acid-binding protein
VILVDTSVWIDYLRNNNNEAVAKLETVLERKYPYGITGVIYQEILQGADSESSFTRLDQYLRTQRFFHPRDPIASYKEAANLYFRCRRNGVTIRSTIDCLIAQVSIEHGLKLLHNDVDFDRMAGVIPELELF